jgi:hypothetical protein
MPASTEGCRCGGGYRMALKNEDYTIVAISDYRQNLLTVCSDHSVSSRCTPVHPD